MAVQGSVIAWVADHRKHHAHTDVEGDPHSPHVGHGEGVGGVPPRPLARAHRLAALGARPGGLEEVRAGPLRGPRHAHDQPALRPACVLPAWRSPALVGYLLTGTLLGAATGLLWGGLVRVFFVHHVTWSVNSICHFIGTRRFEVDDHSTNVFWLALPSLGESWHHNHHAFPRSAVHGLRRWELDPSALLIGGMERVGLAWNVVRIAPERQEAKARSSRQRGERSSSHFLARSQAPLSPRWLDGRRARRDRDPIRRSQ